MHARIFAGQQSLWIKLDSSEASAHIIYSLKNQTHTHKFGICFELKRNENIYFPLDRYNGSGEAAAYRR